MRRAAMANMRPSWPPPTMPTVCPGRMTAVLMGCVLRTRLGEAQHALDVLGLRFEHRQMPALGDEREFGVRHVFAIRLAVRRRHEAVVFAPDEQHRTFDAVQPRGEPK